MERDSYLLFFFSPPTPFQIFQSVRCSRVLLSVLVWLDSVRGSNLLESGVLWGRFSRVGGRDRGQSYFKGDNRGLF